MNKIRTEKVEFLGDIITIKTKFINYYAPSSSQGRCSAVSALQKEERGLTQSKKFRETYLVRAEDHQAEILYGGEGLQNRKETAELY
jgi:hypothetical protein